MNFFEPHCSFRVGDVVYKRKSQLGPRVQIDLQMVYLYSGDLRVVVDGESTELMPGQVMLLLPGGGETFHFAERGVTHHGWCSANQPAYPRELLAKLERRPAVLPLTDALRSLAGMALPLKYETEDAHSRYRDALIRAMFREYLSRCPCMIDEKVSGHPAVDRAKCYIDQRLSKHLNLTEVASEAGVTSAHLIRLFRMQIGMTPMRYIWGLRVRLAMQMLRETGLTVAEVGYRCGFTDPQHFSKYFKAEVGKSPGAYRASCWN